MRRAMKKTDARNRSRKTESLFDGEEKTPPELKQKVKDRLEIMRT